MGLGVISGNADIFGGLASIRRQADAIGKRVRAQSDARRAEEDKTGVIRNPDTGEMVELSSISAETRERWDYRHDTMLVSPQEAMIGFMASDPNAEEVERAKALGARYSKIQDKMLAGKKLTGEEKRFLQEHYPEVAAKAAQAEQEAAQLEQRLRSSKTKEGKHQAYIDAKMRILSGANISEGSDGGMMFIMAALDKAYSQHMKYGASAKLQLDIRA